MNMLSTSVTPVFPSSPVSGGGGRNATTCAATTSDEKTGQEVAKPDAVLCVTSGDGETNVPQSGGTNKARGPGRPAAGPRFQRQGKVKFHSGTTRAAKNTALLTQQLKQALDEEKGNTDALRDVVRELTGSDALGNSSEEDKAKKGNLAHELGSVYTEHTKPGLWTLLPLVATLRAGPALSCLGVLSSAVLANVSNAVRDFVAGLIVRLTGQVSVAGFASGLRGQNYWDLISCVARSFYRDPEFCPGADPVAVDRAGMAGVLRNIRQRYSTVSWLKQQIVNGLMSVGGIKRIAVPVAYCKYDAPGEIRSAHVRSNTSVRDDHAVIAYVDWSQSGPRYVLSCPDVVQILHLNGVPLLADDRLDRLRQIGARLGYLRLPGDMHAEIIEGSSVVSDYSLQQPARTADQRMGAKAALCVAAAGFACAIVGRHTPLGKLRVFRKIMMVTRSMTEEAIIAQLEPHTGSLTASVLATGLDVMIHGWSGFMTKLVTHQALSQMSPWSRLIGHALVNGFGARCDFLGPVMASSAVAASLAVACVAWLSPWNWPKMLRKLSWRLGLRPALRRVAYGYRLEEVTEQLRTSETTTVRKHANFYVDTKRTPMAYSIGPSCKYYVWPTVDTQHPQTSLQGALHRVGSDSLPIDQSEWRRFFSFCINTVRQVFVPSMVERLNEEEWAVRSKRSRKLIARIMDDYDQFLRFFDARDRECKGHSKNETTSKYKTARPICSRSDRMKPVLGAIAKSIEDVVYECKNFIKHVPMCDRVRYLQDMFDGNLVIYETDFTSFEGSFQDLIMAIECWIYAYMLSWDSGSAEWLFSLLTGPNTVRFKWYTIKLIAKRMSGEMNTSLGNGLMNYLLCRYLGANPMHLIVEGDDALFCPMGDVGFDMEEALRTATRLGFRLKIEQRENVLVSKFCGLMMSTDGVSFTDARKVLCNFGWSNSHLASSRRNALPLLRAKALSLAYEHPRCPILYALSDRYEQLTRAVKPLYDDTYYGQKLRDEVMSASDKFLTENRLGPSMTARVDYQIAYGISVTDQIQIERYIRSCGVHELDHPAIHSALICDETHIWADYAHKYCEWVE